MRQPPPTRVSASLAQDVLPWPGRAPPLRLPRPQGSQNPLRRPSPAHQRFITLRWRGQEKARGRAHTHPPWPASVFLIISLTPWPSPCLGRFPAWTGAGPPRWPFKGARFLRPRPLPSRRRRPPPPRVTLELSSPRAAGRRRSAGGGRPFARVGGAPSGSARLDPSTRGHPG